MIRCGIMDYYLTKRNTRALGIDCVSENLDKNSIILVIGEHQLNRLLIQNRTKIGEFYVYPGV